jgi:nucleoside-diphosphate-sugar epimerase
VNARAVLLTGATGFVGANLARRLLGEGHDVHLLVRPATDRWRLDGILGDVRLHEADLTNADAVDDVVASVRPDWVFHLAAHGAYSWQTAHDAMLATNVAGTMNLLAACVRTGFDAFVNAGSSSEYGAKPRPAAESEPLAPNSVYAVTKAAATLYCSHVAESEDVHAVTLRLFSVFGPYEEPERLVPRLVVSGLAGTLPPLASPESAHDFVHVADAVDAFLLAAASPNVERGAVFNVGTGVQTTLAEAVDAARRVLGIAAEPEWGSLPDRPWDTRVWVADTTRMRSELGWRPRVGFEEGLRSLRDWLVASPVLRERYEASAAARAGLPS